jgi:hypothetical protein
MLSLQRQRFSGRNVFALTRLAVETLAIAFIVGF